QHRRGFGRFSRLESGMRGRRSSAASCVVGPRGPATWGGVSMVAGQLLASQSLSSQSLLGELDEAIASGSSAKRVETLRRITDLFLGNADRIQGRQVDLFGDVFERLIEQIEDQALA